MRHCAVILLLFITTEAAFGRDSLRPLTYEETAAIYERILNDIAAAQRLTPESAIEVRKRALAWVQAGPCGSAVVTTDDRLLGSARAWMQAVRPDKPSSAAMLQMVAVLIRENHGRTMGEFSCRFVSESLQELED